MVQAEVFEKNCNLIESVQLWTTFELHWHKHYSNIVSVILNQRRNIRLHIWTLFLGFLRKNKNHTHLRYDTLFVDSMLKWLVRVRNDQNNFH